MLWNGEFAQACWDCLGLSWNSLAWWWPLGDIAPHHRASKRHYPCRISGTSTHEQGSGYYHHPSKMPNCLRQLLVDSLLNLLLSLRDIYIQILYCICSWYDANPSVSLTLIQSSQLSPRHRDLDLHLSNITNRVECSVDHADHFVNVVGRDTT